MNELLFVFRYPTSIKNDLSAVNNRVAPTLRKTAGSLAPASVSDHQQSHSVSSCPHSHGPGHGDPLSQAGGGRQNVSQYQQQHQSSSLCQQPGSEQNSSLNQQPGTFCAVHPNGVTRGSNEHTVRSGTNPGPFSDDSRQPQGNRNHEMHIDRVDKLVINQYPGTPGPSLSPSSSDTPDTGCGPSAAGDTPGRPASSNARDNDVSAESAWRTTGSREVNDNVMTSPTTLQLPSESRGASTSDPQLQASGASERDDSGRRADELRCPEEAEDDGIGQFKD